MVRTTVRLPEELVSAAQKHARATSRSFTELLADALRYELKRAAVVTSVCEPLPTYRGEGLHPEVDLADSSGLEDHMRGQ